MKSKKFKISIFIAILGIASILISQTADFRYKTETWSPDGSTLTTSISNAVNLQNGLLYGGIALLIIGAGIAIYYAIQQSVGKTLGKE